TIWLDDEDVRAVIHAKPKSLIGSWELNTARIDYTHDTGSMVEYHKKFTATGYRVLIYRYGAHMQLDHLTILTSSNLFPAKEDTG
uniref:Uncharacterized protein n=1 Tax=Aegilops tauschii subsp. strangulata TaxID=200361 RepID=A0A453BSE7_AEGTS